LERLKRPQALQVGFRKETQHRNPETCQDVPCKTSTPILTRKPVCYHGATLSLSHHCSQHGLQTQSPKTAWVANSFSNQAVIILQEKDCIKDRTCLEKASVSMSDPEETKRTDCDEKNTLIKDSHVPDYSHLAVLQKKIRQAQQSIHPYTKVPSRHAGKTESQREAKNCARRNSGTELREKSWL
jgi:hypothetical protein